MIGRAARPDDRGPETPWTNLIKEVISSRAKTRHLVTLLVTVAVMLMVLLVIVVVTTALVGPSAAASSAVTVGGISVGTASLAGMVRLLRGRRDR